MVRVRVRNRVTVHLVLRTVFRFSLVGGLGIGLRLVLMLGTCLGLGFVFGLG